MVVEIQAAVRATWPARCADHQAQHAVAPAAHPGIVGFSEQVVDFIHALRVEAPQWLQGEVAPGIEVGVVVAAVLAGRCPVEVLTEIARQRGAAACIAGVEQKVFEVDRDELQRIGQLVAVRAACDLAVVQSARASLADPLLPASQIEQARVVAEGEAALGLATTILRQPNRAHGADALSALADVAALGRRPEAGAVVKVGQFMQQGCQQFLALGAVRSPGAIFCRRAIDQFRQQLGVELDAAEATDLAVDLRGQSGAPADPHFSVQLLDEARGQCGHRLVQQGLARLAFGCA